VRARRRAGGVRRAARLVRALVGQGPGGAVGEAVAVRHWLASAQVWPVVTMPVASPSTGVLVVRVDQVARAPLADRAAVVEPAADRLVAERAAGQRAGRDVRHASPGRPALVGARRPRYQCSRLSPHGPTPRSCRGGLVQSLSLPSQQLVAPGVNGRVVVVAVALAGAVPSLSGWCTARTSRPRTRCSCRRRRSPWWASRALPAVGRLSGKTKSFVCCSPPGWVGAAAGPGAQVVKPSASWSNPSSSWPSQSSSLPLQVRWPGVNGARASLQSTHSLWPSKSASTPSCSRTHRVVDDAVAVLVRSCCRPRSRKTVWVQASVPEDSRIAPCRTGREPGRTGEPGWGKLSVVWASQSSSRR